MDPDSRAYLRSGRFSLDSHRQHNKSGDQSDHPAQRLPDIEEARRRAESEGKGADGQEDDEDCVRTIAGRDMEEEHDPILRGGCRVLRLCYKPAMRTRSVLGRAPTIGCKQARVKE